MPFNSLFFRVFYFGTIYLKRVGLADIGSRDINQEIFDTMSSLYTLQEVRDCASKFNLKVTPEEIFDFWEKKGWKTKKGENVHSLVVAVTVANGSINYSRNKDFYTAKERELKKEYRAKVVTKIKERAKPKPKPYERYSDQLNRQEWRAFRQFILVVRKAECEICGNKTELQIHHLRYVENRKAWEYLPDDMMVLCRRCHKAVHNIKE